MNALKRRNVVHLGAARVVALSFVVVSILFLLVGFSNLNPFRLLVAAILLYGPPLALVLKYVSAPKLPVAPRVSVVLSALAGLSLFWVQASYIGGRWQDFFANFGDERFISGAGYSNDSAFHISVIRSIQETGLPSTGLNGYPFLEYHVLSHYFDAFILGISGLDAWDSYSAMFFLKNGAILLAVLWAIGKSWGSRDSPWFLLTPFLVGVLYLHYGYPAGSHGQWLPSLLLPIALPWLMKVLRGARGPNFREQSILTLLVVGFALGKISFGFVAAAFISTFLLIRFGLVDRNFLLRQLLFSSSWFAAILFFSSSFGPDRPDLPLMDRFDRVWPEIWFLTALLVITLGMGILNKQKLLLVFSGSLGMLLMMLTALTVLVVTTKRADVYWFYEAASMIALLSAAGFLLEGPEGPSSRSIGSRAKLPPAGNLLLVLLLAGLPFLSGAPALAGFKLSKLWSDMRDLQGVTYEWHNLHAESNGGNGLSLLRAITNPARGADTSTYWSQARDRIRYLEEQSARPTTYLLLSKEDYLYLIEEFGRGDRREDQTADLALFVRASLGVPLILGVDQSRWTKENFFGFQTYSSEERWRTENEIDSLGICGFDASVIMFDSQFPQESVLICEG